ncbi:MAG: complex I subunit 4 family protein, partial [Verrucomicrobiales bacterium]
MSIFLYLLIFLPIGACLAIFSGAPARLSALVVSAVNVAICALLVLGFDTAHNLSMFQFEGAIELLREPQLALSVGLDGMSLILVILATLVTLCAVWCTPATIPGNQRLYHSCTLLISAAAIGAFVSTDLFFFYAFHELALIPTFLMIAFWGYGHERRAIAWKTTIYLALGGIILLAGLLALYANIPTQVPTFNIEALTKDAAQIPADTQKWIALTLLVGFGILVSLFPFHSWAAPAYATAPTPVAMLHAGVLKKFGLYGLLRIAMPMLPEGFNTPLGCWFGDLTVMNLMLILLLGNILFIGLVTISQESLDKMLGFSSVMHMGYAFLGIACYNVIGWTGAVMMMFAHGISIALLFALCGNLRGRDLPSLDLDSLGGLGKSAPTFALLFGFAAFASIGLPGFANFASELLIFLGAFEGAGGEFGILQIVTILALWGVVISAV